MKTRARKLLVRARLAMVQNRPALAFTGRWVGANAVLFVERFGMKVEEALLLAACVVKTHGGWAGAYQAFTEVVVFGVIASVVIANVTSKYKPEETCRALAREA